MKRYEFIESYIEGTHGFLIRDDEEKKPLIRCKDCKSFSVKEHWAELGYGAKMLCADKCPTCEKWGDGCKTDPDGYCFLAKRKE